MRQRFVSLGTAVAVFTFLTVVAQATNPQGWNEGTALPGFPSPIFAGDGTEVLAGLPFGSPALVSSDMAEDFEGLWPAVG